MIITGLMFCYFFVAGVIFRDMIDEVLPIGPWPPIGAFIIAILWIPFFIWAFTNTFCKTTKVWWIKFATTIFIH